MLCLDPVGINFQILNQIAPHRRDRDAKFLAPRSQRFPRTLTDRLLNPTGIIGGSGCYQRARGPLPSDLHKCRELQSSLPTGIFDFCFLMC